MVSPKRATSGGEHRGGGGAVGNTVVIITQTVMGCGHSGVVCTKIVCHSHDIA